MESSNNSTKNAVLPKDWHIVKIRDVLKRVRNCVEVKRDSIYREIGIKSHGKGIFYKDEVTGDKLGDKSVFWVEPDCFILNIVFAWELAVARTTKNENGMIASHRFPMYRPLLDKLDLDFITYYFKTPYGRYLLNLASPGGAGRNKTLGQEEFYGLEIKIPKNLLEQKKIATILSTWDNAIKLKEKLIEQKIKQKEVLMKSLLTGSKRLPGFNKEWKEFILGEIFKERKEVGFPNLELLSITSKCGVVKRSEIDLKDNSSDDKSKYKRICPLDIGYNTMRMWQGVSGVSNYEGIVSPAYTILIPTPQVDSFYMGYLFKLPRVINTFWRHSQGLVDDTLNLKYENFKKIKLVIPSSIEEQRAIAKLLLTIDKEIELIEKELELLKQHKKGLMQLLLTGKVRVKC